MADTAYTIIRGYQDGKQLTSAQKNSSLFSEEPMVLGRVLRRGSRPMRISAADFKANEVKLLALEKAGAIVIKRPEQVPVVSPEQLQEAEKKALVEQHKEDHAAEKAAPSPAGDPVPPQQEGVEPPKADSAPPAETVSESPPAVIIPPPPETEKPALKPSSTSVSKKKKG